MFSSREEGRGKGKDEREGLWVADPPPFATCWTGAPQFSALRDFLVLPSLSIEPLSHHLNFSRVLAFPYQVGHLLRFLFSLYVTYKQVSTVERQ